MIANSDLSSCWLRFDTVGAHDSVRPCRHFVWADRVVRPYNLKNKTH